VAVQAKMSRDKSANFCDSAGFLAADYYDCDGAAIFFHSAPKALRMIG
jgi:hypothetical protein